MDQSEFFTLAVIHFLAIASPGPNVMRPCRQRNAARLQNCENLLAANARLAYTPRRAGSVAQLVRAHP